MNRLAPAVARVREALADAFDRLDAWFDESAAVRGYRPADGGWTGDEILEHVSRTTYYLLIIIRRQAERARRKARGGSQLSDDVAPNLDRLAVIADPMAFRWIRPDHMEPTGQVPSDEVRALLREQRDECLALLDTLRNGEGLLVTVGMSVNGLGKMDLYQWLYFVAQHAKRHLVQLARNEANFAD